MDSQTEAMQLETSKKIKSIKSKKIYKLLEQSLLDQLEASNKNMPWQKDLVKDYMQFYITKELLAMDIAERGVSVYYNNGGGQSGRKKNDSVAESLKVNNQMLAIIKQLGLDDEIGDLIEAL